MTTVGGRELIFETGELAGQANGSVLVTYGETVVLVTAVVSEAPREGIDFFPLTVDVEEKLYAAGKIPGGFPKREGRPPERSILASRLTDRPIRPLFPKGFRNDVQVVATVLSADQENDPDTLAICGASAALCISDIPFKGPVAGVRVGYIDGEYVINPTETQLESSRLDLVVAGTRDAVMMVEAGAMGLPEDVMLEAVRRGHEALQPIIDLQERLVTAVGKPKRQFALATPPEELGLALQQFVGERLRSAVLNADKTARRDAIAELRHAAIEALAGGEAPAHTAKEVGEAFDGALKALTRSMILNEGIRPDGRDTRTIRPISCKVGLLPRTHGSGLFTRGQTQVLSTVTLGPGTDEQIIDDISAVERKRFLHHYNFPPFSTGETKPLRGPGRREIGHGALAERSLVAVIPPEDAFPYVIRLVAEVLASNGSTSMASVCAGCLALMDAGVPIAAPVAGIAMGLITDEQGRYAILTDIQGIEDALGDMDFKVAGTADGVTGLQMDIKVSGITFEIMQQALQQAREARLFILEKMHEAIPAPRAQLSRFAPRITSIKINPEKIGALIGPGGKNIRGIQDATKTTIEVQDDGTVNVASTSGTDAEEAIRQIRALTQEVEVGQVYQGIVKRLMSFGAFVEILPNKEGLVRMSELAPGRVENVEDVVSIGDPLEVKVIEIDAQGRINLSHRQTLPGQEHVPAEPLAPRPPRNGGGRFGGDRGRPRPGERGGRFEGGQRRY
ncbi:MAG TPA: polyribonucleotide nucleotidyltransferase [Chloroflexota bacterium]|nr:polyribonucleotide nucleotidyltransferase [Chloroflexota bacterium]